MLTGAYLSGGKGLKLGYKAFLQKGLPDHLTRVRMSSSRGATMP